MTDNPMTITAGSKSPLITPVSPQSLEYSHPFGEPAFTEGGERSFTRYLV
jgi:hypothetical protein